jgi:hypothetical protein
MGKISYPSSWIKQFSYQYTDDRFLARFISRSIQAHFLYVEEQIRIPVRNYETIINDG